MGASTQVVPEPEQKRLKLEPVPQQGWFSAPHPPHDPLAMHMAATEPQLAPTATQEGGVKELVEPTQQLPSVQRLPGQHGTRVVAVPAVPHFWQRVTPSGADAQTRLGSLQREVPGQHSSPAPPHFWHEDPEPTKAQIVPASLHFWPAQHGPP